MPCIKLCEEIIGRDSALTRPRQRALLAYEQAKIQAMMKHALDIQPMMPSVRLKAVAFGYRADYAKHCNEGKLREDHQYQGLAG